MDMLRLHGENYVFPKQTAPFSIQQASATRLIDRALMTQWANKLKGGGVPEDRWKWYTY